MVRRLKSARYVAQNWRIEMEEKKIVETLFVRRSVNVSEQDIDDILCTAFEGGITYWCDRVRVVGN